MQPLPHTYRAAASGAPSGVVQVKSPGLPELLTACVDEVGSADAHWAPEKLMTAAIADCYVLTFRAVSGAALFGWLRLECQVQGMLESLETGSVTSGYKISATLTVRAGANTAKA